MAMQNFSYPIRHVILSTATELCMGPYCGRTVGSEGQLSECAACPRGYRPEHSICVPCNQPLSHYDWMYLAFMALLPVVLHGSVVDTIYRHHRLTKCGAYAAQLVSTLLEAAVSAVISVFLFRKSGMFNIVSCGVHHLGDWYTWFFNPIPDYVNSIRCTQEVTYPLYSMVFVYYFFSLVFLLVFRAVLSRTISWSVMTRNVTLAALYEYPVLFLLHAFFAGVLYYNFPYVVLIVAIISSTVQCAVMPVQTVPKLCSSLFGNPHSFIVILLHWAFLAFGVVSVAELWHMPMVLFFLSCIPIPILVYVATIRFTDPAKFSDYFNEQA